MARRHRFRLDEFMRPRQYAHGVTLNGSMPFLQLQMTRWRSTLFQHHAEHQRARRLLARDPRARARSAHRAARAPFAAPERPSCTSTWKSMLFVFFASSTFSSSTGRKVRRAYPLFFLTPPCVRDALAGRYRRHRGVLRGACSHVHEHVHVNNIPTNRAVISTGGPPEKRLPARSK